MPQVPDEVACPNCVGSVTLDGESLLCGRCGKVGRLADGVWDFVAEDTYAESFGRQWTTFPVTQLDSRNGTTISRDQFARLTEWSRNDLEGKTVLDGGCGSGRYAEIALDNGARVIGFDLSMAAYAARANFPDNERFEVVRGNLLQPPLRPQAFDKVFSIGVVQSTPDPLAVARQLARMVRPDGELLIWMYEQEWFLPLLPRTLIRPITTRLSPSRVMRLSEVLVNVFTPVARAAGRLPTSARKVVQGMLPIVSYWGELPLTAEQQREWSVLDTHDWIAPKYTLPQRYEAVRGAIIEGGLPVVERVNTPGLTIRATAPAA